MRPWKPATDKEVKAIREEFEDWVNSETADDPPSMPTWRVMSLVMKIEQLQKKLRSKSHVK